MLQGISRQRLLLYGAALAGLLALNLWNWQGGDVGLPEQQQRAASRVSLMPSLHIARDLNSGAQTGTRDLFSRRPLPVQVVQEPVIQEVPRASVPVDPKRAEMARARKMLSDMKLIGVMSAGQSSLAVLYHNGNTTNWSVGDEVLPGYKLDRITRDDVQLSNQTIGVSAVLSIGGQKPLQLIRVD